MAINDSIIEEKLKQLKKAIEIVGGKEFLEENLKNNEDFINYILNSAFNEDKIQFNIGGFNYTINELLEIKQRYEKSLLKTKNNTILSIANKIKCNKNSLYKMIKYFDNDENELNEIFKRINDVHGNEIDALVLKGVHAFIKDNKSNEELYGDYLKEKKEDIIKSIIRKVNK